MKTKWVIFTVLAAFFVLVAHSGSQAANTRDIDIVRNKPVLESTDLPIINDFVDEAVRELVNTRDFSYIAQLRNTILARRTSRKSSAQTQYTEQFSQSAHKYISEGFKEAELLKPKNRSFMATLNLLILIDGLEDLRLAEPAIRFLKDENTVIRYWAVHSLTSPGFTKQLDPAKAANLQLARRIVEQLKTLVGTPGGQGHEILALVAEFAAEVGVPQGEVLLGQIADLRIKKYADWTVDYEFLDGTVLKLLYKKISTGAVNKAAVSRRFGQLYSYVIQRYVKGRFFLNPTQKHQLASVLVEIEKSCISRLLAKPQTVIKRSIERVDYTRLLLEHSSLLGDQATPGRLPEKLNFNYGTNPNGSTRTAPLTLPDPPLKPSTEE
ncbi:MAG: hypothetical protein FVQ85_10020 [Planctomycetes bacterium]|nr:hypothetical protein [Planctomycetota bacterium]